MSMPMKNKFSKIKMVEDKFTWDVDGNLAFAKGEDDVVVCLVFGQRPR